MAEIHLVSGGVSSGKTALCRRLADEFRSQGALVSGLLSPQRMERGAKVEIFAMDLATGEERILARRRLSPPGIHLGNWSFVPETIDWGNTVLSRAVPTEILIIDELGPLELENGSGWVRAIEAVDSGRYERAFVAVRPALAGKLRARWPHAKLIDPSNGR